MIDWKEELAEEYGWENDEAVTRWLIKLRTKQYAKRCLDMLKLHCEKAGKPPTELIDYRVKQITNLDPRIRAEAEETVLRIHGELAEEKRGVAINYFRKMKSFYKHNYCQLGCSEPEYTPENHVEDRKTLEKLDRQRIRDLCEKAQLEVRFGILVLAESGGRIGAVADLRYRDIKDDLKAELGPHTIWLKQQSRKKGGTYPSFICGDAVRLLHLMIKDRELEDEDRIFTIGREATQEFLRENGLHAHLFRKRFQTTLEDCDVPLNWVDRLLGHQPRGAQGATYSLPPISKLREQYSKAVRELEIYGSSKENRSLAYALAKVLSHFLNQPITEQQVKEILKAQNPKSQS